MYRFVKIYLKCVKKQKKKNNLCVIAGTPICIISIMPLGAPRSTHSECALGSNMQISRGGGGQGLDQKSELIFAYYCTWNLWWSVGGHLPK